MNIPLNIDWQQILLHALNFAILVVGLYLLLYKPVKKFMEKRKAYYQQMDDDANRKLADAAALEKEYQEKLTSAEAEIAEMKKQASDEVQKEKASKLQSANEEAEKIIKDAETEAAAEHDRIVASSKEDIAKLAAEAVDKISKETLSHSYDEFLNAAQGEKKHGEETN